jgi:CheY-like chemotaxis protein
MPRLLYVEDHPDTLLALTLMLKVSGFEVTTAISAAEADAKLASERFDLVLADLTLRNDTFDHERSWSDLGLLVQRARPARIGVLSGWQITAAQAVRHGLDFALLKPCDFELLLAEIRRVIQA